MEGICLRTTTKNELTFISEMLIHLMRHDIHLHCGLLCAVTSQLFREVEKNKYWCLHYHPSRLIFSFRFPAMHVTGTPSSQYLSVDAVRLQSYILAVDSIILQSSHPCPVPIASTNTRPWRRKNLVPHRQPPPLAQVAVADSPSWTFFQSRDKPRHYWKLASLETSLSCGHCA